MRRLDLGLTQKEAAVRLAVDTDSVRNWEAGRTTIAMRFYPALLEFLGHSPFPQCQSEGQLIERERKTRGWSRKRLALLAGVDEATVKRLEIDRPRIVPRSRAAVPRILGMNA